MDSAEQSRFKTLNLFFHGIRIFLRFEQLFRVN